MTINYKELMKYLSMYFNYDDASLWDGMYSGILREPYNVSRRSWNGMGYRMTIPFILIVDK